MSYPFAAPILELLSIGFGLLQLQRKYINAKRSTENPFHLVVVLKGKSKLTSMESPFWRVGVLLTVSKVLWLIQLVRCCWQQIKETCDIDAT